RPALGRTELRRSFASPRATRRPRGAAEGKQRGEGGETRTRSSGAVWRGHTAAALARVPPLLAFGTRCRTVLDRAAGLPRLQHGGWAVAAAAALHLHAAGMSLMAGWHENRKGTSVTATRSVRELIAAFWRRLRRIS